jgi:hypothetical protein
MSVYVREQADSITTGTVRAMLDSKAKNRMALSQNKGMTFCLARLADLRHFEKQASELELGAQNLRRQRSLRRATR